MLYMLAFEKLGLLISDLYFLDPFPDPGQGEGPERGIRLELRLMDVGEVDGTIYASHPITAGRPLWRGDLLETADGPYGSFDRTHHHVAMDGWEPDKRVFDTELSADPIGFLAAGFADLPRLLGQAKLAPGDLGPNDERLLREAVPEIVEILERMLKRIYAGELALAPSGEYEGARESWL